jgi:TolB-like protein/DNA-binding winged helix-turn-helix (wHTH) protein/lipoprotein NlpI
MVQEQVLVYEFGAYRLDVVKRLLLCDETPVDLPPKAFDTLLMLVENYGTILEKETLIKRIWPDTFVEEGNLTYYVSLVRKALGESPGEHKYIVTIPKRGYSFVAEVSKIIDHPHTLNGVLSQLPENAIKDVLFKATPIIEEDSHQVAIPKPQAIIRGEIQPLTETLRPTKGRFKLNARQLAAVIISGLLIAAALFFVMRKVSPPSPQIKSIAVLPFKLLNANSDCDGCLELGMADALIAKLSKLENISVRPTSAILSYNERRLDPLAAGRELRVDAVMEGTVQRIGERVRVRVQLIKVSDGKHLWGEQFDEEVSNVFKVQDSISQLVAQELALKIGNEDQQRLAKTYTDNPEAYKSYIRGVYFWTRRGQGGMEKSIELFEKAIEIDPNYAKAYAMLGDAYGLLGGWQQDTEKRKWYLEKADAAVTKALALDDTLAEAHTAKALVLLAGEFMDYKGAEKAYKRALELNPNYSTAHVRYGWFLLRQEQLMLALSEMQKATELDPAAVVNNTAYANMLFYAGYYDQALEQCNKVLELDPNFTAIRLTLGHIYEQKGMYDKALEEMQKYEAANKNNLYSLESLGHLYAVMGRADEVEKRLVELEKLSQEFKPALFGIAIVKCGLGEKEEAAQWMKKTMETKALPKSDIRFDPRIKPLLEDQNFQEIHHLLAAYSGE